MIAQLRRRLRLVKNEFSARSSAFAVDAPWKSMYDKQNLSTATKMLIVVNKTWIFFQVALKYLWVYIIGLVVVYLIANYIWDLFPARVVQFERAPIPKVAKTYSEQKLVKPFEIIEWLGMADVAGLRQKEGVINFAFLQNGNVKYSKNQTVPFLGKKEVWKQQKNPGRFNAVTVNVTFVELLYNGQKYNLNVMQPFSTWLDERTIYIIDTNGDVWSIADDSIGFEEVSGVVEQLGFKVEPNPNLTLSK